uniref:Shaggy-related protein kinase eta n=1 Tax=Rhizophora mucronata TaxID=61149 RepID=A0A2P2LXT8_RHIMU
MDGQREKDEREKKESLRFLVKF